MTRPVHAEGAADKKSIYDREARQTSERRAEGAQLGTTRIAEVLRTAREAAACVLTEAQREGQQVVNKWICAEKYVERVVRDTVPRGEKLVPGLLYVGVAALAGPIFTRKRNFAVRWMSPVVFGAAASAWFLPGTSSVILRNVWGRYGDPATIDQACDTVAGAWKAQQRAQAQLAGKIQELRMSLQEGRGFTTAPAAVEAGDSTQPLQKAASAVAAAPVAEDAPAKENAPAKLLPVGFTDSAGR
ncbi:hypothetical protein IWQ56_003121 [Coemansia nantahalensis]|uniref:Uncharacterized protein n=1 Tax=Coemansia nantahalensis TaxID=2789366 RepID=A0ACC1JPZ9_9FUNG|nr:hypothetical protein IWQ57_004937 [Coemansia nantahalensis]KAJ2767972.1 hypothetical protein IWQ56_003121 [Coemansia nantahalensis]